MINIDGQAYLDVREAAERLGVKPETLYAYVSRGTLRSYRQGIRRRRLYLLNEVEALLRLRPGGSEAAGEDVPPSTPADAAGAPAAETAPHRSFTASNPDLPPADHWAAER